MRRARAQDLGIHQVSDLRMHPGLVAGLGPEFLGRADGWNPLCARYGLQLRDVRSLEHTLGYVALAKGEIDLMDAYSTDAKIVEEDLVVLKDDQDFFPQYQAVLLYRLDADPRVPQALSALVGTMDEDRMTRLNAMAERARNYALAADEYFQGPTRSHFPSLAANVAHWTGRHMLLVAVSLMASILLGIPLGIWANRPGWVSEIILGATGVIQTIPSLALLALLVSVPFLGISPVTAIIALFLYGLLPIVRNTASGLQDIPRPVRESAEALGLEPRARLFKVFLPLASRSILAGIKTSAVINVGTAVLAALIGAGGLGEPILSGLNLNDRTTIFEGAVPAAVLALLVQAAFSFLDRFLIPKGLQINDAKG
jgi:osmoprotectant transport system permease protein